MSWRGSIVSQPLRVAYREGLTSRLPERLILLAIVDLSSEALLSTAAFESARELRSAGMAVNHVSNAAWTPGGTSRGTGDMMKRP